MKGRPPAGRKKYQGHARDWPWRCQWDGCPHPASRLIRRGEHKPFLQFCASHTVIYREALVGHADYTPPLRAAERVNPGA